VQKSGAEACCHASHADYSGSNVMDLSLRELELLHRLSFGHRNQRSYLVVLYKPDSPACQAFEAEVCDGVCLGTHIRLGVCSSA
jgi:hypothetical protein